MKKGTQAGSATCPCFKLNFLIELSKTDSSQLTLLADHQSWQHCWQQLLLLLSLP